VSAGSNPQLFLRQKYPRPTQPWVYGLGDDGFIINSADAKQMSPTGFGRRILQIFHPSGRQKTLDWLPDDG
jgi:hypothetical protein